jgi:hypothetical protein
VERLALQLKDWEKWTLGIVGGIVTLILGYLVWRHENAVQQQEAEANNAAQAQQQAESQDELEQLMQQMATVPQYASTGEDIGDDTTDSGISSPSSDGNIQAILDAFFGNNSSASSAGTGTTSTGTGNNPITEPTNVSGSPALPAGGGVTFGGTGGTLDPTTGQPPGVIGTIGTSTGGNAPTIPVQPVGPAQPINGSGPITVTTNPIATPISAPAEPINSIPITTNTITPQPVTISPVPTKFENT